jgi:hypothetical protein
MVIDSLAQSAAPQARPDEHNLLIGWLAARR